MLVRMALPPALSVSLDRPGVGVCVCVCKRRGGGQQFGVRAETVYQGDHALLCIAYVMLTWAVQIPATRWHCSLQS